MLVTLPADRPLIVDFCPSPMCADEGAGPCDLHQPITLHCGHTISASHIKLPRLQAPDVSKARNQDEASVIMQEHHTRKLAMWTNVRCPLPFCRQHDAAGIALATPAAESVDPLAAAEEAAGSNVQFYPSRLPLQAVEAEGRAELGTSGDAHVNILLDVTVGKALYLVQRQIEVTHAALAEPRRGSAFESIVQTAETESEADADEESGNETGDQAPQAQATASSAGRLALGSRASQVAMHATAGAPPLHRSGSKRRRTSATSTASSPSDSEQPPVSPRSRRHRERRQMVVPRTRTAPVHQFPQQPPAPLSFEKELMGIVECDVCALLLYEPVTTPCQHVSRALSASLIIPDATFT